MEVVSPSTEAKDFEDNLSLHAALGIPEYLLVDAGEFKTEPHMWLFRRAETDGACHVAENGPPCACGPRLFPATCPCSSARTRKPGMGMITREALNAGGSSHRPAIVGCRPALLALDRQGAHRSLVAGSRLARRCLATHPVPAGRARTLAGAPGNVVRTGGCERIRTPTQHPFPRTPLGHSRHVCHGTENGPKAPQARDHGCGGDAGAACTPHRARPCAGIGGRGGALKCVRLMADAMV